jgi:hypothetical protein
MCSARTPCAISSLCIQVAQMHNVSCTTPVRLHRLAFFENGTNPFLSFYASEGQIGIDPSGDMNDGTTTSSGSCIAGSMAYDPSFTKRNQCCTYSGYYGTFKTSPFSPLIVLCQL